MAFNVQPLQISQPQAYSGGVDWSPLAKLGEQYKEGVKQDQLADLGKKLANGEITYQQAAGKIAELGDSNSMLKFLALSEQEKTRGRQLKASQDFGSTISGTPSASETIAAPPSAAPRIAVAPNPADDEPAPTRVAALPPGAAPPPQNAPVRVNPDGSIAGNITAPNEPPPAAAPPVAAPPNFNDRFAASRPQGAPSGSMLSGEGPTIKDVPRLLSALANPDLPDAQKEIAKDLYKRAMDSAKPTEKIATLTALKEHPELLAIEKELRRAQKTDVNILPGEKKQDEEMGKTLGELHSGYIKEALKVPATKATLDAAERAMASPGFVSGSGAPFIKAAQRAGVALGLVDADKASPGELFAKLQNKAIMDAGGSGSGLGPQISNNDAKIIRDSTFNESNTIEGNKKVIGFLRLMEDRKVDYTREMNRYARAHGGRIDIDVTDHMANWAEKNPLNFAKIPGFDPKATSVTGAGKHKDIEFKLEPE